MKMSHETVKERYLDYRMTAAQLARCVDLEIITQDQAAELELLKYPPAPPEQPEEIDPDMTAPEETPPEGTPNEGTPEDNTAEPPTDETDKTN